MSRPIAVRPPKRLPPPMPMRVTRGAHPNPIAAAIADGGICNGMGWGGTGYTVPFVGITLGGTCTNVDGQPCGASSVFMKGQCTVIDPGPDAYNINGPSKTRYQKWVEDYYTLAEKVVEQMVADGVRSEGGSKFDARWATAMKKMFGKARAAELASIKSGKAPGLFYKMLYANDNDVDIYAADFGGFPVNAVMLAARDGAIPPSALVALPSDNAGPSTLKALSKNLSRLQINAKQTKNPFPAARPAHPTFTPPTIKPGHPAPQPVASVNPTWGSPGHDAANASNNMLNASMNAAINTGNLLDSVLAAGGGGAWNSATANVPATQQLDPETPTPGPAEPQGNPGSTYRPPAPPPPPDYSHMTGLGRLGQAGARGGLVEAAIWFGGAYLLWRLLLKGNK